LGGLGLREKRRGKREQDKSLITQMLVSQYLFEFDRGTLKGVKKRD